MKNIKDKLQNIDKDCYSVLLDISKAASEEQLRVYLVGGMVRDLLLGVDNLDIDIVVENKASLLADALTRRIPHCKLSAKHDRFHTAKVVFDLKGKKIPVDLASTREEIYEHPAALPKVRVSELKKDLYRRDFTINALAISLLPDEFGEVVDLFDGLIDLKNKKIRVLHNLSFIDDPTRMIRAIRFATKLNFKIEEYTQTLLKKTISSGQFDNLIEKIRGDRVKIEIRYLFNLPNIKEAVEQFFDLGIYKMVNTSLRGAQATKQSPKVQRNEIASSGLRPPRNDNQWLIILAYVMKDLSSQIQEKVMKNLQLTNEETKSIKGGFAAYNRLQTLLANNLNIDSIVVYHELKNLSLESILIVKLLLSPSSQMLSSLIDDYLERTTKIKLEITGEDLIAIGIKESKAVGEILEKILEKKIICPGMKKEDELKEASKWIGT